MTSKKHKLAAELSAEAAALEPTPAPQRVGRMRNYSAMRPEKLLRVKRELEGGRGNDAYDRCLENGSGDPASDLAAVKALCAERGL